MNIGEEKIDISEMLEDIDFYLELRVNPSKPNAAWSTKGNPPPKSASTLQVWMECPVCGTQQEDMDGFGFIACQICGYCIHPNWTKDETGVWRCGICSKPGEVQK